MKPLEVINKNLIFIAKQLAEMMKQQALVIGSLDNLITAIEKKQSTNESITKEGIDAVDSKEKKNKNENIIFPFP